MVIFLGGAGVVAILWGAIIIVEGPAITQQIFGGIALASGFVLIGMAGLANAADIAIGHMKRSADAAEATLELMRAVREKRPEKPKEDPPAWQ